MENIKNQNMVKVESSETSEVFVAVNPDSANIEHIEIPPPPVNTDYEQMQSNMEYIKCLLEIQGGI